MKGLKLPFGPGALVAAAFIGPGTVTTCTVAGASFGFALIWALVFATLSAIILQEMSGRLGVVTGNGLGFVLVNTIRTPVLRYVTIGLVLSALLVGNAAYEAGNITGATLGLEAALKETGLSFRWFILPVALIAAGFLLAGTYRLIEGFLIALVLIMCGAFLVTVIIVRPDMAALFAGLKPSLPDGSLLLVLALIGTTVVPYNLFLHAAAAGGRWQGDTAVKRARTDTVVSVGLGGLISILILSTAASTLFASGLSVSNAADMAIQLEPAFGNAARWLIATGLFAAGLSSAITAPLATAYAVTECFQVKGGTGSLPFRLIALGILAIGASVGLLGLKPISIILFAQFANGLLLPVIATFLLVAMNRREILGDKVNSMAANILGAGVVLIAFLIGARLIWLVATRVLGA